MWAAAFHNCLRMKLWKQEGKEGAYREFLDATDFALVGGDINGDGSFRRHRNSITFKSLKLLAMDFAEYEEAEGRG
ncbi:hypothetical protein Bca4012_079813 [Brassica carinata]